MPSYLLKQPDGKFACFSAVVDGFTAYDMTKAQALEFGIGCWGRDVVERKLRNAIHDQPLDGEQHSTDGLGRWRSAIDDIAALGVDTLKAALAEIGFSDADVPQSTIDLAREASKLDARP